MKLNHRTLSLIAGGLASAFAATPALAQTDRIIDTETGWGYIYGANSTTINSQLSSGQRPFSLERVASGQYDTLLVSNAGPYAVTGTQMLYGATTASLATWLSSNNLRLLELEPYDSGGSLFVTAVGVPNSGATATPGWGYLVNVTFAQVASWLSSNPSLRLIDLDAYSIGGTLRYSAVAVPNSGANFQSGWWYGGGMSASQVTDSLTTNGARLICLEVENPGSIANPNPTFACVMVSQNPGGGWWHQGLDSAGVAALLDSTSSRVTCFKRYTNYQGQTRWAVATVDNANAQTRRMRSYIWGANSGGSTGFMLKQVGGPVLASNNVDFVWEPCSSVKLLHGIYSIYQCSLGIGEDLTDSVLYKNLCASCPFTWTCSDQFRTLTTTLANMLQPSDNFALISLERRYGVPNLNAFADSHGFGNITMLRQDCNCGVVLNTATCTDFCEMLEQASNGSLFNSTWENTLQDHMNNLDSLGYGSYPTLSSVITQEAALTDLTGSEISAFRTAMEYANKGGNYGCGQGVFWRTEAGFARVPFKVNSQFGWLTVPREYVFSLFAHNATNDQAATIVHSGKEEILREQIREALESWDSARATPAVNDQPDPLSVAQGQSAQFHVGNLPNPEGITYTWFRGALALSNGATGTGSTISGATTGTIVISNVGPVDAGTYSCRLVTSCGTATSNGALLTVTTACYANCDGSTTIPVLNVQDFSCFLNRFAAGDSRANCDNSTVAPVLNVADFSCFLNKFASGCS